MRECPKCHYVDPAYWHPRIFDYEIDIARMADVEMEHLEKLIPGQTVEDGVYAYKVTKSRVIYRMWLPIFRARGWSPKPGYYDGITSPGSASYKRAVSTLASMAGSLEKYLMETPISAYKPEES